MHIEIVTLCEYAAIKDGNLSIFSTFENWFNPEALDCMFVVKARFEATEAGSHTIGVRFSDSDGVPIFEGGGVMDIQPQDTRSQVGFLIGRMSLRAPQIQAGDYQFEVVDQNGAQVAFVPLYIKNE